MYIRRYLAMAITLFPRLGRSLLHQFPPSMKQSIPTSLTKATKVTKASISSSSNNCDTNDNNRMNDSSTSKTESTQKLLQSLQNYHPLFVEGKANGDTRDPRQVTNTIVQHWNHHKQKHPITKPIIMIVQGDPLTSTGISAITRLVASDLDITRVLICLDESMDPTHATLADRDNVSYEFKFSDLTQFLNANNDDNDSVMDQLRTKIKERIQSVNTQLDQTGKHPLRSYVKDYALLQEGTKAAFRTLCGEISVLHTYDPPIYSVTGFYKVGLEVGTVHEDDMIYYDVPSPSS